MKSILKKIFGAADTHGVVTGNPQTTVEDLQEVLSAAWSVMNPVQQQKLLHTEEVSSIISAGAMGAFKSKDLIADHAAFNDVTTDHTIEGFSHSELAAAVKCFDQREQTIHRSSMGHGQGIVLESPYALAARFIRSVVATQMQKAPAFWYSEQHGKLMLRYDYEEREYDGYTWHPLFSGVNADVQVIGIPHDWPTSAMEDAFAAALPKLDRSDVDHPNDTGRPNLSALFDGNNFRTSMRAAFMAAPILEANNESARYQAIRAAVAASLTGVYYCDRTWTAWAAGTMNQDDFSPAAEVDEVLDEITTAVISAGKSTL